MNIFLLSWLVTNCARYHCNKHVVKMILETTQLLSTCWHMAAPKLAAKYTTDGNIYKKTHYNHPCSVWTRECKENYIWLCHLGIELCKEYAYRYDKSPEDHKCYSKLIFLKNNIPPLPTNNNTITRPRLSMPYIYKLDDPIKSYRTYYLNDKKDMLVWRKRDPPYWVPPHLLTKHYESEKKRIAKENKK